MAWFRPDRPREVSEILTEAGRGPPSELSARDPRRPERPPIVFTGAGGPSDAVRSRLEELEVDVVSLGAPGLSSVVQHEPGDLVVTVGAGMRVDDLARALGEKRQWLPVSESRPGATVGGLVAAAAPTPLDPTFGSVRRHVLACRVVSHEGRRLRWGRPVVKNVAGYDLPGLWCGSRGRLGALTEVSLRVWPLPPRDALFEVVSARRSTELLSAFVGVPPAESFRADEASWSWHPESVASPVLRLRLFGPVESVAERGARLARWAADHDLEASEVVSRSAGPVSGSPRADPLARVVAYLQVGRRRLAAVAQRLMDSVGDRLAELDAYPLDGTLRCEFVRSDGVSLRAVVETAGEVGLLIDRAGVDEHELAARRRAPSVVDLERRLLGSLGGRERHWIAEHV